ncbi:MAG: FKBP-type peptidyl-prolyl cis-trans isomerase [Prevotella sp.]|jgi:FKBP-type peptidyl-prolyl cis-trans isomerase SlyD|uniref:FKBP-type peptidyl-prolyl cis-trans isomerase n=1 Tax=Prevotella sp. PTAC TaxID=2736295 RepID=UPI00155258DB|nr:FKBP-type peptidyl-prolyl cis-trans isomerase [Prevotella sp. PTAC]MCX4292652.1 FKBP-type peptidyl-prolyl cis-trans isomerase [Prevotella sp.]NPD54278.1 peptidylprolyl isomerase [Prevotella sp. PTAC]
MEKQINKYIAVDYKLYTAENGESELVEETTKERPFQFISGFGITLEAFEKNISELAKGDTFDFTLTKEEAYGDFEQERVLDLEREMFCINGHFDHEHIFKDAIVPLQNEDGNRFYGRVMSVDENKVKMDLNHPLAGKSLNFKGTILENREATNSEIQGMINRLSGEGCGCGCGDCEGGCGGECGEHHDHDCGCGHCH